MCGIAGIIGAIHGLSSGDRLKEARQMIRVIRHRGPDGEGYAEGRGWALGHARLAILDPENGSQPMADGRGIVTLTGNHEIYNAPELRQELEKLGIQFRSRSDTEVIVRGWIAWGHDLFKKMRGMFALAIVDERSRKLLLARDPIGIKPLYWARRGRGIVFASEMKAILRTDASRRQINFDALHLFMNLRYLVGDQTLLRGIEKVTPGVCLEFDIDEAGEPRETRFFDWASIPVQAQISFEEARERLRSLMVDAVKRHLQSDVEVGAFLSGGLDSSVVAALAKRELGRLRTFAMGFGELTDENVDARRVAGAIGSDHEDVMVGDHPLESYSRALWHVEEPKVNCLQGYALDGFVSKHVKVALSGLGGDELFAGYTNNDVLFPMLLLQKFMVHGKSRAGKTEIDVPVGGLHHPGSMDLLRRCADLGRHMRRPLQYYAIVRNSFDHDWSAMRSIYRSPKRDWLGMTVRALKPYYEEDSPDRLNAFLRLEARTKLVNDFLLTEDRVSMAHGLETRVPLLDLDLATFAFSLDSRHVYSLGEKKKIFRSVSRDWVPSFVLSKRKQGFSFNPHQLFGKGLREFASRILTRPRVEEMGLYSWPWIEAVLAHRPSRQMRWHYFNLWVMAGVTLWSEQFVERMGGDPPSEMHHER